MAAQIRNVAVIDVGKTNAKLALVALDTLTEIAVMTRRNKVQPAPPYPHFDTEGHWRFFLGGLRELNTQHGVDAIAVTTHGASAALLAADGSLAAPILDYEHSGPDELTAEYDAIRPDFAETGSPRLAGGLNVGAQLFWQLARDPGLADRIAQVVPYPQYWTARLTGVAAGEATSWGAHTDMWNPQAGTFSSLPERLGLGTRMARVRPATDIPGPILPAIAAETGLRPDTPVACGLHDSNASHYPHVLARAQPFTVVSTGTWVICLAQGGAPVDLDPARDTLVNVNALGQPVPSARFMGGREYELTSDGSPDATEAEIAAVLRDGPMLLPAVDPANGPFQGQVARWTPTEPQGGTRAAALGFYLALVTAECLANIGHRGTVIVEGAFARNRAFLGLLAAATGADVHASASATGTSAGAALLFHGGGPIPLQAPDPVRPLSGAADYIRRWTREAHGN